MRLAIGAGLPLLAGLSASLAAQDDTTRAEEMIRTAREAYGPAQPPPRCDPDSADPDVIVVCAELEDQSQFRVRTDEEARADYARATMDAGTPRAPNFAPPPCKPNLLTVCANPPPPGTALIIDLDTIPEAPEGSDADRIGRGEKGS